MSNGYFHLSIRLEDRTYFGFSFDNQYFVFNSLCFGYRAAPDYFQAFSQDLVRICREWGILCKVELGDFLIYADSFKSCLNSVNFVVDLFKYFGIKILLNHYLYRLKPLIFKIFIRCSKMSFYTYSG